MIEDFDYQYFTVVQLYDSYSSFFLLMVQNGIKIILSNI